MRIAVNNLMTGRLDILILSPEAEELYNEIEDVRDFFENLGYDYESISWGEIKGIISEEIVEVSPTGIPYFRD